MSDDGVDRKDVTPREQIEIMAREAVITMLCIQGNPETKGYRFNYAEFDIGDFAWGQYSMYLRDEDEARIKEIALSVWMRALHLLGEC